MLSILREYFVKNKLNLRKIIQKFENLLKRNAIIIMRAELSRGAQKVTFHIFLAYYVKHTKTNTNTNLRAYPHKCEFCNATIIKNSLITHHPISSLQDSNNPTFSNKFHIRPYTNMAITVIENSFLLSRSKVTFRGPQRELRPPRGGAVPRQITVSPELIRHRHRDVGTRM